MSSVHPNTFRRIARIALPAVAFVPIPVVALRSAGILGDCFVFRASLLALAPGVSLAALAKSFGAGNYAFAVGVLGALAWLSFVAYALYRIGRLVTAEDFVWSDFLGGLLLGFIPGAIFGWRGWIVVYKSASLATCIVTGGLIGGVALGIYMGSCWSKTRYE